MGLETGSFISDLVATNPTSTDVRKEGDDHIRLIKAVLKATFPNLDSAVTATPAQLNASADVAGVPQIADAFPDTVISGLLPPTSGSLTTTTTAGVAWIGGVRVVKDAAMHTYTANKDTYIDLSDTGLYTYTAVNNGAAAPAITADSIRLAKVVSGASTIGTVTDLRTLKGTVAFANDLTSAVMGSLLTAKGSIFAASAASTAAELVAGDLGNTLVPNSGAGKGLAWIAPGMVTQNLALFTAVGANACVITLKGADGADLSEENPGIVAFFDATVGNSAPVYRKITSNLTYTMPSASTYGTVNSTPFNIWVVLFDTGSGFELGVFQSVVTGTGILTVEPLDTMGVASASSGGVSTGGTFATTNGVTSKPFRVIGALEWATGLAAAGTWSAEPTTRRMYHSEMALPGRVIKPSDKAITTANNNTGQVAILSDVAPTKSDGFSITTLSFTPRRASSLIEVSGAVCLSVNSGTGVFCTLCDTAITAPLDTTIHVTGDDQTQEYRPSATIRALSTSARTYDLRAGAHTSSPVNYNSRSGSRIGGGALRATIRVREIAT